MNQPKKEKWSWYLFSYHPDNPEVVIYETSGWDKDKLSLNFAHKLAYLYLIMILGAVAACVYYFCHSRYR